MRSRFAFYASSPLFISLSFVSGLSAEFEETRVEKILVQMTPKKSSLHCGANERQLTDDKTRAPEIRMSDGRSGFGGIRRAPVIQGDAGSELEGPRSEEGE
jgi:hypothetical protein